MGFFIVLPFVYQSYEIPFGQWVGLLTLALAPLLAHIAAGTSHPSLLACDNGRGTNLPPWHDRLCVYNPTTIIWRYAAITDRRIRAKAWNRQDMAAANALFWVDKTTAGQIHGKSDVVDVECLGQTGPEKERQGRGGCWDGTEDMAAALSPHCMKLPLHAHAELLSWETVKTLIVTLQGLQVLYAVAGYLDIVAQTSTLDAADTVFSVFAILGLLRLCAAAWLTSDYLYMLRDDAASTDPVHRNPNSDNQRAPHSTTRPHARHNSGYIELDMMPAQRASHEGGTFLDSRSRPSRFHPTSYLPSILFRIFFMICMLVFWIAALLNAILSFVRTGWVIFTLTGFLTTLFYIFFMTVSCGILLVCFAQGKTSSTVIPCIGTIWYKTYTLVMFAWMATMFIIACLETTKMPCGGYTSTGKQYWPPEVGLRCR